MAKHLHSAPSGPFWKVLSVPSLSPKYIVDIIYISDKEDILGVVRVDIVQRAIFVVKCVLRINEYILSIIRKKGCTRHFVIQHSYVLDLIIL